MSEPEAVATGLGTQASRLKSPIKSPGMKQAGRLRTQAGLTRLHAVSQEIYWRFRLRV